LISSRIEIIEEKMIDAEASKKKEEQWEETIKMCGAQSCNRAGPGPGLGLKFWE
jgi:hypothetical protein